MNTFWFSYRGLSPHKFTPMRTCEIIPHPYQLFMDFNLLICYN
jgi:hypothetical protein